MIFIISAGITAPSSYAYSDSERAQLCSGLLQQKKILKKQIKAARDKDLKQRKREQIKALKVKWNEHNCKSVKRTKIKKPRVIKPRVIKPRA